MKIRIYKNADGKFLLLATDKSIAVGISGLFDTEALATALATEFTTNSTVAIGSQGNFLVPTFTGTGGAITFIKCGSQEEADKLKAAIEGSVNKLLHGVHEDLDTVLAASKEKVSSKATAAVRKFKKGITSMDNVVYGLVTCTLTYLPTNETGDIGESSDETVFAGVVSAGSTPVAS
jgi:hypothetical protein